MNDGTDDYYYVHDHLYSPAALLDDDGSVIERYEYDVYGYPHIMNASYESRETSDYSNPYMFTGRRVDILDSNSLTLQYNRNRYYDYYTGRFTTHDSLGYVDGLNLYEYVKSNPLLSSDSYGLMTESEFAFGFISNFFFGRGRLWSRGADVLKRQEDVKKKIADQLKILAHGFCRKAVTSGGFARGSLSKVLRGGGAEGVLARENAYMRWTLNGVEAYIMVGSYEAQACAYECPCTVKIYDLKHIWNDSGDLNLGPFREHWPDWLVWYWSRIGLGLPGSLRTAILHHLGLFATDFPVRIEWEANNRLWKRTVKESFSDSNCSGWPWPLAE